jgi:hypothetical protein
VLYRSHARPRPRRPLPRDRRLNATLGSPLASREELTRRAAARERLAKLRATGPSEEKRALGPAPLLVYFEKDRNVRELVRIEELLSAKGYEWKRLDVAGDEATMTFVVRQAEVEPDDLPIVFVADRVVGNYDALVRSDVSGELERLVRPS